MPETIESIIASLARERGDYRLHFFDIFPLFDVEADGASGRLALSGRVLEESDLQDLLARLKVLLPEQIVDISGVEILRKPGNPVLAVGTNLTSLHREPSFIAEQLSQLLNGMQVEILFEQGRWCYVRQMDGYLGWTYRPYLTTAAVRPPTHIAIAPVVQLRAAADEDAAVVTRLLGGTSLAMLDERSAWAEVELAGGLRGWAPLAALRALKHMPLSADERRAQLPLNAAAMTGTPYLWGGNSANGIDCSGLAQLVYRWAGLDLPRDADLQCAAGRKVEPPFRPGDLLFFGEQGEQRNVTHVAISLGGWQIIHSSRSRNGVYQDNVQAVEGLRDSFLEAASFFED